MDIVSRNVYDSNGVLLFEFNFETENADNLNWEIILKGYSIPEGAILSEPIIIKGK